MEFQFNRLIAGAAAGILATLALTPSASAEDSPAPQLTGRVLVTVKEPSAGGEAAVGERLADVASDANGTVKATDVDTNTSAVAVDRDTSRSELTADLKQDPRVVRVTPEHRATPRAINEPALTTPDPSISGGSTPFAWWANAIGLPDAWAMTTGSGIKIAVIDQGVDASHPQISGIIAAAETNGSVVGNSKTDETGHGTHVASLACSAFNDGAGLVGAGGDCRLIVIKSDLSDLSVAASIRRATELGADAIVMSFGVDGVPTAPAPITAAISEALNRGVVPVAAAADSPVTQQGYPANIVQPTGTGADLKVNRGLSVTASTASGARAAYAGVGNQISLAAPGTHTVDQEPRGLLGAFPTNTVAMEKTMVGNDGAITSPCLCRTTYAGDRRYGYLQGTSMSAPIAAGVAGLVKSINKDLSAAEISEILKRTASGNGTWSNDLGWGVLNAAASVDAARKIDRTKPTGKLRNKSRTIAHKRTVRLVWNVSDKATPPLVASGVDQVEIWRQLTGRPWRRIGTTSGKSFTTNLPKKRTKYTLRVRDKAGNLSALRTTRSFVTKLNRR